MAIDFRADLNLERLREHTIPDCSDEDLLQEFQAARLVIHHNKLLLDLLEFEMHKRMDERGATGILTERYIASAIPTVDYDQQRLLPLKEVFTDADLQKCFTPEHEETVTIPHKFNMVKTIPLAKRYGAEALKLVTASKVIKRMRFTVEER